MIRTFVFDLDGTLVQSEKLKSQAYAIVAQRLLGLDTPDQRAVEAYRQTVGAARDEASRYVMDKLGLEPYLRPLIGKYQVSTPQAALTAMRVEVYSRMVADPQVVRDNQWPHAVHLLRIAREAACRTALASMSLRSEVQYVLNVLNLSSTLDLILTLEDVQHPKPDPEIYRLATQRLGEDPKDCLALEDSPNGVRSALMAGLNVIALATPFTAAGLHESHLLNDCWVVHHPNELLEVVTQRVLERPGMANISQT